jgi:hypothetical protein
MHKPFRSFVRAEKWRWRGGWSERSCGGGDDTCEGSSTRTPSLLPPSSECARTRGGERRPAEEEDLGEESESEWSAMAALDLGRVGLGGSDQTIAEEERRNWGRRCRVGPIRAAKVGGETELMTGGVGWQWDRERG